MVVDGRKIAEDLTALVRREAETFATPLVVRAIVMQPSPATESYLRIKERRAEEAGMRLELIRLEDDATTADVIRKIELPGADAIIVQLPLPDHVDTEAVLDAIPLTKDADVLSRKAQARFREQTPHALLPPVVGAIVEILERHGVMVAGKRAVVLGQGKLVGEPVTLWLRASGAVVTTRTRESGTDGMSALKEADLVISGVGSPGLIRPEHLSQGVVLVDAGTSESGGAIVGDADPACAEVASLFTPVPGGVGPVAVAYLMKNVLTLAQQERLQAA